MFPFGLGAGRSCLLFVSVFVCFEQGDLVLDVLNWK